MSSTSSFKPLILHAHNTGPNPYKVAIALELLHIPYTVKLWEFGDGPNGVKGPAFLRLNPNGRVPTLEDPNTGVTSWESGAVLNYLLRVYDTANTLSPGDREQDRVDADKWIFFLVSTVGPMLGQLNWYRHYNPTKNEDALARYVEQTYRTFGVLEGQLKEAGSGYVLPKGFGAVDVHFYPWVKQYGYAGLSLEKYPLIAKWLDKVGGMAEVKAAYEKVPAGDKA